MPLNTTRVTGNVIPASDHNDTAIRVNLHDARIFNVKHPDYGATGLGVANDGTAVQAAITAAGVAAVSGHPGATVVLPPGVYRYTTALSIPPGVSIIGYGRGSVLKPEGCNGMTFQTSNYIGPSRFENFYMEGNGYTYDGVVALGDADAGRVQGVTFADTLFVNFRRAFYLRSTHGWHLDHVQGYEVWNGVYVAGQTILLTVDGGSEFQRFSSTGSGSSTGIYVDSAFDYNPSGTTEQGCEGLRFSDTTCFGFAKGVNHVRGLDCQYRGMTLGGCSDTGFEFMNAAGGMVLRDSWIGLNNGATYGIHGTTPADLDGAKIVFDHVNAEPEAGQTTAATVSIGAYIEYAQTNVHIQFCRFKGFNAHDIKLNWAGKVVLNDNSCKSGGTVSSSILLVSTSALAAGPYYLARNMVTVAIAQAASSVGDVIFETPSVGTVTAAATTTLPPDQIVTVTGNTNITNITASYVGRRVTLIFTGTPTLTDGGNLKLASNLVATADDTVTLVWNGTSWFETARAVN